jgi:hypothetical protein
MLDVCRCKCGHPLMPSATAPCAGRRRRAEPRWAQPGYPPVVVGLPGVAGSLPASVQAVSLQALRATELDDRKGFVYLPGRAADAEDLGALGAGLHLALLCGAHADKYAWLEEMLLAGHP